MKNDLKFSKSFKFPWWFKIGLYGFSFMCMIISIIVVIVKGILNLLFEILSAGSRENRTIEKIVVRVSASNFFSSESPYQKTVPNFKTFGPYLID